MINDDLSELQEIKNAIQQLSDRITKLENRRISDKQYFEYLADQAISKLTVIPDFNLYRENVKNDQSKVMKQHLNKLPTDLIQDRKDLVKMLNKTTKMPKDLSYGIGELSANFEVKLGEMENDTCCFFINV